MSLRPHIFVVDIAKDIYKKGYIKRLEERERHVMLWDNFIWKIGSKHPKHQNMSGKREEDGVSWMLQGMGL